MITASFGMIYGSLPAFAPTQWTEKGVGSEELFLGSLFDSTVAKFM